MSIGIIQAGDVGKTLAASLYKFFTQLDIELLQRFNTFGNKSRRQDRKVLYALLSEFMHGLTGIGLQPFLGPEA